MSKAYNTTKFKVHVKGCKASPGKTLTMTAWAKKLGWKVNEKTSSRLKDMGSDMASAFKIPHLPTVDEVIGQHLKLLHYLPCPGITAKADPHVAVYIPQTGAGGGGAQSVTSIAQQRYGCSFTDLDKVYQELVRMLQQHEYTWRNDHTRKAVFSTKCKKHVDTDTESQSCMQCLGVLNSRAFKNALQVPLPPNCNYKFLNHRYHNDSLGLIYAKSAGLQELFEDEVCFQILIDLSLG